MAPSPAAAQMRRVAAMPSRTGMRMSMRTTSGRCSSLCCTASSPSAAVATTVMSSWVSRRAASPARTACWSSTTRARIVRCASSVGRDHVYLEAATFCLSGREGAAGEDGAFAHAQEPVPLDGLRREGAGAVVPNAQVKRLVGDRRARHRRPHQARVAAHSSVPPGRCGRRLDRCSEATRSTVPCRMEADVGSGRLCLVDQVVELGRARAAAPGRLCLPCPHAGLPEAGASR